MSALGSSDQRSQPKGGNRPARTYSLWPREHGAYAQLAFPLVTALAHAHWSLTSICFAFGAVAVFLAHEPALILMGHRGVRALDTTGRAALHRLALLGGLAVALGSVGLVTGSLAARGAAFWSLGLGLIAAVFVVLKREKTVVGEMAASVALALAAYPVAVAGRIPSREALSMSLVWALVFVMSTCAVQVVISATKRKQRGVGMMRAATLLLAVLVPVVVSAIIHPNRTDLVVATVPVSALCVGLCFRPPHARRLREVGWGVVAACTAALAVLLVGVS